MASQSVIIDQTTKALASPTSAQFYGANPPTANSNNQVAYVSASGNDSTASVGNEAAPYLTIGAALDALTSNGGIIYIGIGTFASPAVGKMKDNVAFIGAKKPAYNSGFTALEKGTILQGKWDLGQAGRANVRIQSLGVDVGDAFTSGTQTDGIIVGNSGVLDGVPNLHIEDVIVLGVAGNGAGHGFSLENISNLTIRDISTYGFVHGCAIKGRFFNVSGFKFKQPYSEGLILKNGTSTLRCEDGNVVNGIIESSLSTSFGVIINGVDSTTYPLRGININNIACELNGGGAIQCTLQGSSGIQDVVGTNIYCKGGAVLSTSVTTGTLLRSRWVNLTSDSSASSGIVMTGFQDLKIENPVVNACTTESYYFNSSNDVVLVNPTSTNNATQGIKNFGAGNIIIVGTYTASGNTGGDIYLNSTGIVYFDYSEIMKVVTSNQSVTNSNTLTDSTELQISVIPGNYDFESWELVGSSDFTNAGSKSTLVFTGTGTFIGVPKRGLNAATTPIGAPITASVSDPMTATYTAPGNSLMVSRRGRLVVTASGTLKIQFAQNTAVAANTATLYTGSYMCVRPIR